MKTSVETLDEIKVKLSVEVEPERVKRAFNQAARELAKQVNLPGFRPGKAPRKILEQRFGAGAIAQTAMEASLTDYYIEALRAEEVDPVAQPELDVEHFDEEQGCVFTATVEVRPTFEPPDHTGIHVTFPDWQVSSEEVDEQLASLQERYAEVDEVDRAAEHGDYVTINFDVAVDGEQLESAHVEDALYEIGSGGVTPKLDEELIGKAAGDEFSYEDNLPDEYPEHGGQPATFSVTVIDVRAKSLPELDDDFAATASSFDTLDELRDDLRASLERRKILNAQHELRGQVLDAYLARVDIPLPPAMIDSEVEERLHQLEHQAEQYGMALDDLLRLQDTDKEQFTEQAREQATSSVKARLVLDQLSQTLEVKVEPADIEQEIVRHAQTNNMQPNEVAQIIQEQGSLPALVGDIMRRNAIDAIVDTADIENAPDDDTLIALGLKEDPSEQAESGLIVPGADEDQGGESELIVPGRD